MNVATLIESAFGSRPTRVTPLAGGSIATVYQVRLDDADYVAKVDLSDNGRLDVEGYMLNYLARRTTLPLPEVVAAQPQLLLLTLLPGASRFTHAAECHAAQLLADLHSHSADRFGHECSTLIGKLTQPNRQMSSWIDFFREQRLGLMASRAAAAGTLPLALLQRLQRFAADLDRWLIEPPQPALIHGDIWATNLLAVDDQITAVLDPAIYYADPEIELAYIALFNTFGAAFFDAYSQLRPLQPGFFETRRHIYALYPLLVHVLHFGAAYLSPIERTLARFGY